MTAPALSPEFRAKLQGIMADGSLCADCVDRCAVGGEPFPSCSHCAAERVDAIVSELLAAGWRAPEGETPHG